MQYDRDMFKSFIQKRLERYVKKYFAKYPDVKLIVVAGSVGKTSTKRALASLLSQRYRVRMHQGNHNTEIAAPLAILGIEYPSNLRNLGVWLGVFRAARLRLKQPKDVDIIIQEVGTDHPGDLAQFGTYLNPDIALVTAVTPEHMEFFGSIESVAQEELSVSGFSKHTLINRDDVEGRFADFLSTAEFSTYGTTGAAEYRFEQQSFEVGKGYRGSIIAPGTEAFSVTINVVGEHSLRPIMGAIAAGMMMGLTPANIVSGLAIISPVPGRMNMLKGIDGVTIIDDTYNSSPAAAAAALQTLYSFDQAPQRIAILGSMNELGESSRVEHEKLGQLCDGSMLAWLVLVGDDAKKYISPIAKSRGCQVYEARDAIDAGQFVRKVSEPGGVVLAKGSQGGIYLEEAVKILCNMSEDDELVRQSPEWLATKSRFFARFK